MEYGYKTLILVDNSASVTPGNREIVKETLKYLIKNAPEGDEFALATYSNQTEMLVDYGLETEEYMQAIDKIIYTEKITSLCDVLMDTINSWSEADFAMRNIILFTDGQLSESVNYPIEEVYFKLNESTYPLYVVGLNQQTNDALLKRVASLARISHGEMFYSDFEDSEADVEKKLTEKLLKAMNDKRVEVDDLVYEEEEYEYAQDEAYVGTEEDVYTEDYESDVYAAEYQGEVQAESLAMDEKPYSGYVPLMVIGSVIVLVLIGIIVFGKLGKKEHKEKEYYTEAKPPEMTLEDMNNPMMYFKLSPFERAILGSNRDESNITISDDEGIAGRHCEINYHFGKYYVRDLNSLSGTYLNGERIKSETELRSSDVISMGRARLMVKLSNS